MSSACYWSSVSVLLHRLLGWHGGRAQRSQFNRTVRRRKSRGNGEQRKNEEGGRARDKRWKQSKELFHCHRCCSHYNIISFTHRLLVPTAGTQLFMINIWQGITHHNQSYSIWQTRQTESTSDSDTVKNMIYNISWNVVDQLKLLSPSKTLALEHQSAWRCTHQHDVIEIFGSFSSVSKTKTVTYL